MFTSSWTWRTVVQPSCLGTRISSQWFLTFLSEKPPHRETLLRHIHGHLLVLIALLAALSHPGHWVRHSETSRQLRRCRQWGPFNEDVSSKRAVFNAIWSIYRLMAAPASPIAPAQEEIVHRRAVRRNTVYTDPLTQSIFQPNYLELNFISHLFKFFLRESSNYWIEAILSHCAFISIWSSCRQREISVLEYYSRIFNIVLDECFWSFLASMKPAYKQPTLFFFRPTQSAVRL